MAQKYLAAVISAAAETAAIAAEAGEKLGVAEVPMDFEVVFSELTKATPRAMRWFVKQGIAAAERGDFAASGRQLARLSQIQGGLVLVEALTVVAAVALVVLRLGG